MTANIKAGDVVDRQTAGGGIEQVGVATVDRQATITFTTDPSFLVGTPVSAGAL